MAHEQRARIPRPLLTLFSLAFWVGLWWVLAATFAKPLILPTPPAVLSALFRLAGTGEFWRTVFTSLARILAGILAALLCGALLAVLTVKSRVCHTLFAPLLTLFKATPVASVIFLVLLWVGRTRVPLLIAFIMALPIVWSNVQEGILQTDRQLVEMAKVFRLSFTKKLRYVQIPSVFPYFLAACRSALSLAWKAGVAAEVLCVPEHSIGRAIYEGKQYLLTDELFAWTLVVIFISVAIESGAMALLRLAGKQRERRGRDADAEPSL